MKRPLILLPALFLSLFLFQCSSKKLTISANIPDRLDNALPEADLIQLYGDGLKDCYPYMFKRQGPQLVIHHEEYGKYTAGLKGFFLYSGLPMAVTKYLDEKGKAASPKYNRFYDMSKFEVLSGKKAFTTGEDEFQAFESGQGNFHHYNPEIVKWGFANLIPDPESEIAGYAAKLIYSSVFQRFFRLLTECYLDLNANDYHGEINSYKRKISDPDFDAIDHLNSRFKGKMTQYHPIEEDFSSLTPPMAYGFWIRRGIDGSADELWKGLGLLMVQYDKAWLSGKVRLK